MLSILTLGLQQLKQQSPILIFLAGTAYGFRVWLGKGLRFSI